MQPSSTKYSEWHSPNTDLLTSERITGRRTSPCQTWEEDLDDQLTANPLTPKSTTSRKILKKEVKTWESLLTRRMKAIRVETPPLRTAGPMSTMAAWARSFLLPDTVRKAWQMCTGTRSWWWWWQTLMRKHNRHVMEDFQWKVWKYFNNFCFLRIRVVITMTDLSSLHRGQWQWWRWRRWRHQWWAPRNAYSRTDPPLDEDNLRYESCILCIYQCDCNAK